MRDSLLTISLADFLAPHIKEAKESYNLKVIRSEEDFVAYKGDNGADIRIRIDGRTSYTVEIDYLSKRTYNGIDLDILNDLIITDIQIP